MTRLEVNFLPSEVTRNLSDSSCFVANLSEELSDSTEVSANGKKLEKNFSELFQKKFQVAIPWNFQPFQSPSLHFQSSECNHVFPLFSKRTQIYKVTIPFNNSQVNLTIKKNSLAPSELEHFTTQFTSIAAKLY